ncbi:MAG: hypothetical protein AB1796_12590 [Bacillota bacterium]
MRLAKALSLVLLLTLVITSGSHAFSALAGAEAPAGDKHWVYAELVDFKLKLGGEDGQNVILNSILSEANLDKPIKIDDWAYLLDAVLKLPPANRAGLLEMYAYNLATENEIAREDAVGGMVKLLTIEYLSGTVYAEDLQPAEALKDLSALSDRQETLVRLAYSEGLVDSNTITYFRPQERLTVAEAVSMLHKVILKYDITFTDAADPVDGTGDDKLNTNLPQPGGLAAEIEQYRDRLQKRLLQVQTVEAVLLGEKNRKDKGCAK